MFVFLVIKLYASHPHLDLKMAQDELQGATFGKPSPDKTAKWYPYESKTVCHFGYNLCIANISI